VIARLFTAGFVLACVLYAVVLTALTAALINDA
jgi:hypothetical protein